MFSKISFHQFFLAIIIIILFSFVFVDWVNQPIEPEILQKIENRKPTDIHLLEKNRMQIFFMKERGWYFIFFASIALSTTLWIALSNQGKNSNNFIGYKYRIADKLMKSKIGLNFQERLQKKYMKLTTNDLLVAKMLVDGLTTKEISFELNISPASANTTRYRLRKRMKLSAETDLVTFLKNI